MVNLVSFVSNSIRWTDEPLLILKEGASWIVLTSGLCADSLEFWILLRNHLHNDVHKEI